VQQTLSLLASNPNPVGPEAYNRQAQAYLRYDSLDRLADIKSPTLVIAGEQDLLTPPWICREVADRIPGARFEIMKGDGSSHVVPIERPDQFNELVTRFLVASEPTVASAARADRAAIGAQG
jgi:pimeloyl-ACP methyl ester carboxylesterase